MCVANITDTIYKIGSYDLTKLNSQKTYVNDEILVSVNVVVAVCSSRITGIDQKFPFLKETHTHGQTSQPQLVMRLVE